MRKPKSVPLSMRMPEDQFLKLKVASEAKNLNISEYVREVINDAIDERDLRVNSLKAIAIATRKSIEETLKIANEQNDKRIETLEAGQVKIARILQSLVDVISGVAPSSNTPITPKTVSQNMVKRETINNQSPTKPGEHPLQNTFEVMKKLEAIREKQVANNQPTADKNKP